MRHAVPAGRGLHTQGAEECQHLGEPEPGLQNIRIRPAGQDTVAGEECKSYGKNFEAG